MASKDGYKRRQTNNDKSGTAKKVAAAAAASSAKKAVEQAAAKGKAKAKAKTKTSSGRTTAEKQRASSVAENTAAAKIQQNRNDRKAERDKRRKERALEQQRALEQAKKTPVSTAAKGKRSAGGDRGRTDAERDRKKSNEQLAAYRAEKERNARSRAEKAKPEGQGRLNGGIAGITEVDKRSLASASRKPRQTELPEGEVAETPFGRLMQKTFYSGLTTGLDSSVRGNLASGVNRLLGAPDPITDTVLKYSPAGIGLNFAKDRVVEPSLKKLGEDTGIGDAAKKITDWRDKTQAKVTESLLNDKWTRQRDDFNQKLDEAVQKDGAGWRTAGSVGEAAGFLAPSLAAMMLTRNPAAAATRLEKFGKIGQALSKTFGHGSSAGTAAFGLQAKGSYMSQEYEMQKQKVFEDRIKAYETAVTQYNSEIAKINNRGSMTATEEAALSAREKELNKMYEELLTSERDGIDLTCAEILNAAKKADVTSDILALAEVGTEYLFGGIAGLGVGILDKPVNYVMGRIGRQILSESTQKGLDQFAKSTAGKMLYNVKNYLGEAGEEAIMQVVQPYIERGVGDLDTANATMKEVAEAGGVGALLSMVLGVPGMAYHVGSRGVQKAQEIRLTGLRPKTELYSEEKLSDASRSVISSFAASEEGSVLRESAKNNERMTKDEVRDIFDDYLADQGMSEKEEEAIREEIESSGGLSVALAVNMGIEPSRLGVSVKSHLKDLLSGKGDLAHRSDASEVMTDGQRIYTNAQEAVNDLVAQSKKAEPGTDLVAYIADEHGNRSISLKAGESNVPIFRTAAIDAKTNARMDRMRNAKTETERTGLMYGVKDSVIAFAEEVSEGSGRKIIFDVGVGGGQLSQDQIANASYENGEIRINPNSKNPFAQILAHELTHSIEGTAYYEQMKKLVFKYYRSSLTEAQANVKWTYEGQVKSIDDINSEVMAEFFEKKGITDMETLRSIVKENRSFAEKFVDWLNRIIQRITGTKEQRFLLKVRNQWKKALRETKEGIKNTPAEAGVEAESSTSEKDGSERISDNIGSEVSFSVTKDDALFEKAVNRNAKLQNVSGSVLNEAGRVRETIKALYQDKFIADEMSKGSTRQGNGSYGVSFENTTICSRSLALESIVEAVAKKIGRPLNERESIIVAQEFMQYSPNPECLYCYQANAKRGFENALNTYLEYRKAAIERHRQGMSFEENLDAHLRSGRNKSARTARQEARVRTWIRIAENGVPKAPAIYFTSTKAINDAIADPKIPKAIKDQLKDAKSFAQGASRAHKRMYYAAYNGEILKIKQSKIDEWNGEYGIRMYSFSDFSPAFILENMQMVTDAAVRGAKMLAYTKEADFVNIFGSTGMAINISVAGYESNGEFVCDGMQGMEWEEAKALRNKYPAAGIVYVAKNDHEVEWAMDQEWIDTVIPFHISSGSASMAEAMNWQNYSQFQSEKAKDGGSVTKLEHQSVYPPEHLNDKDTYLAKCEEYGLVPKFERWIDHPGYMKLVNETRLATNEMEAVQPVFNEEAAKECLNEFAGYDQPVGGSERAKNFVVDSIGNTLSEKGEGEKRQYSISQKTDAAYMAAVKRGDMDEAQRMVDEAAKAAGYSVKAYHGTNNFGFTVFENENPQHYSPTIFFADRTDVAESYANFKPYTYQSLKDSAAVNIDEMDINQLCEAITKEFQKDYAKSNKIVRFEPLTEEEKRRDIWGRDIRLVTTDLNGRKFVEDKLYDLDDIVRWLKRILKNEGVYGVYLSMKNPIVIDCKGGSNREIDVPDALKDVDMDGINPDTYGHRAKTLNTDEMAALAHKAGYDGVVFKDVMDVASELHEWDPVATDYVVFDPSQVKSADPVTYDNNGNVIPLSERFDEGQSDIRYSVSREAEVDQRLLGQFNDWMNKSGQLPKEGYFTICEKTPAVFRQHGALYLPIIMHESVLIKVTGGKHSVAMNDLAKLPYQLEHPILLFKGSVANSFVVLTDMQDKSGEDIVVAIHLNRFQKRLRVNRIASIYGKDNIVNYVTSNISNGNLLHANKKKAPIWFTNRGLQLPKLVQTLIGASDNSILDSGKDVNEKHSITKKNQRQAASALVAELKESLGQRKTGQKELNALLKSIKDKILDTGAYSYSDVEDVLEQAYSTGGEMESMTDDIAEAKEYLKGQRIYIPKDVRSDVGLNGSLSASNRKMIGNRTSFTTDDSVEGIDVFYREISAEFPSLFPADIYDASEQAKLIYGIATASDRFVSFEQMDNEAEKEGAKPEELIYETMRKDIEDTFKSLARLNAYDEAKPQEKKESSKKNDAEKQRIKDEEGTMRTFDKIRAADRKQRIKDDREALRLFDKLMREKDRNFEALDHSWKVKTARLVKKHKKELDKELERTTKEVNKARDKREKEVAESYDKIIRDYERGRIKDEERALKLFDKILAEDEALALEFLEIGDFRNVDRVVAFYDRILKSERAKAETKRKAEEALKRREEVMKSRAKDRAAHKERMEKAKEMLRESNKAARANIPKGSRRDMYLKNRSSQKVAKGFVGDILNVLMRIEEGFLTENDISVIKNSKGQEIEVVFDENGQILYERKPGMEHWDISTRINELTPGLALVYEAEQQGIDGDQFYTIYAALKGQVPDTPIKGLRNVTTKKAKQMRYINSLDLTARQKNFLYLDVCNFYSDGMPLFQDGGTNKAVKGNRRGRLARMLDEIALDMYAGNTIELKTVNDLVDLALGTERNEQWQKFHRFVMDEIVEASELMLKTKIITEMPVNSKKVKNKGGLKDEFRTLYSRFVAEGEGIETMGSHVDDPLLTARYYAAKASRSVSNEMIFGKSQRDLLGKEVGKSLNKIFKPIAGNEEKMDTLTKYCNYRHDIYRLKYDKGYTGLSVEELEERCRSIEKSDPDIVAIADEVVGYARNLLKMCVQANRISQADYEFFVERYPYYVPTFRVTVDEVLRDNKVKFRKIRVIKEAQGGSEELLPLFEQLVRRTHEMIKACKLNMLAQQIAMNARKPEARPFVEQPIPAEDTVKEDVAADIASMGAVEDVGQRTKERGFNNYIPWWSNGKQYNIPVTDEHVLYAWDRINYKIDENMVHKVLRNINNVRRGVLTQYSPTFPITNGIRDYFDMFIYNKHAHRLPKFHALALKGIFTRSGKVGEMFNEYMSYGATNASIFEYANTNAGKKPRYTKARAVFEKIDAINFMIEQSPRFAVYLETVDRLEKQRKKGKNKYTDEEIKTIASYNAADATLNFGRSGTYIKAANTYGATFLNAGVQGADRLRRMFAQTAEGTLKEQILSVIGLAIKAGLLGMAPNAIITVIWNSGIMRAIVGDDDYDRVKREFDEMSDFTKINYLVLWINGTWVKIPTGRVLSWLWSHIYLAEEVYDGNMDPLDAIVAQMQNFAENILPANPVTNGILGPLVEVALNKNWMGYAIVDDWNKREDGFRYLEYDEDTTEAAKAIAAFGHYITGTIWGREDSRVLDLSPMKLDYLMQQYFGSYSGIVMPFLSGSQVSVSEKGYEALMSMAQKFYTDPVYSNRLANDYYTAKNYVDAVSEVYDGDTPYAVASDYFKEHGEKLKEIRDEIDAVNRNTNLSRKERKEKARELREQLNDLYREGLNGWEDILGYAMQNYDGKDRNRSTYNDAIGSVKGAEYSISTLSDTAQEQYKACSADGVSAEDFYDAYKFSQEVKSTRDASGKEVEGESKQDKVTAYLESRDASAAEKKSMWKNLFGYKSDPPAFSDGGSVSYNPGTAGSPILDSSARISSGYGPRNAPTAGASSYHRAIDIAAPGGTAVAAAMNGTVTRVSRSGGYGISVEVTTKGDDGNSYVTKYSHLLNTGVEVGQNVQKGVKIAEVDSTGTSTGNHLDFKLAINGDWVDPTQYLTAIGNGSLTDSGYSTKGGSGGSSTVRGGGGGKRRSGGGSRRSGGGSRKSGGSLGTFAVAGREDKATVKDVSNSDGGYTFSRQGSGTSGSSTVASSKPVSNHAGTSTKNEKYASHGAYLPKASDSPYLPRYSDIASSNTRTKKTTRSNGRSMWDESVLG